MKKIPTLFKRDIDSWFLIDHLVPGAEWVAAGEGIATQKLDGTCCMVRSGELFKRYELKKGRQAPAGFEPVQDPDPTTGDQPGWLPCRREDPADRWHFDAFDRFVAATGHHPIDWTYELCGPKVHGNPEVFSVHVLCPHGGTGSRGSAGGWRPAYGGSRGRGGARG